MSLGSYYSAYAAMAGIPTNPTETIAPPYASPTLSGTILRDWSFGWSTVTVRDTNDESETTAAANELADAIGEYRIKSVADFGGGGAAEQLTTSLQPRLTTAAAGIGGRRALEVTALGQFLLGTITSQSVPYTIFACIYEPTGGADRYLFDGNANEQARIRRTSGNGWELHSGTAASTGNSTSSPATAQAMTFVLNGSSSVVYSGTTQVGGSVNPGSKALTGAVLGNRNRRDSGWLGGGLIAGVVIMAGAATAGDRTAWANHTSTYYGV